MPEHGQGDPSVVLLSEASTGIAARASSVLQRNTKLYGPMNALDLENDSSCWNSEGSTSKACWFSLDFQRSVYPTQIRIQFQAGFCAKSCAVYRKGTGTENNVAGGASWDCVDDGVEWEDVHEIQAHELQMPSEQATRALKLVFDDFTDFYGRVTIYRIEIWGKEQSCRENLASRSAQRPTFMNECVNTQYLSGEESVLGNLLSEYKDG